MYQPADFVRDVESVYQSSRPETIWSCDTSVKRLLASQALAFWVNEQLETVVAEPTTDGDWTANQVTLHRGAGWSASVSLLGTARRYIHALASFAICAPLAGVPLIVERYRLPDRYRNDVFDPSVRLEPLDQLSVAEGDLLPLCTDRFAYYFTVPRPIVMFRLETASVRPLEWLFSHQTLQAWQANDADLSSTQLRVAAYVLGKIAHQSSLEPLRQLTQHPHHAVRWAAIQNLGRLNRSEALVKIRAAVSDSHPHVRRAAQKTLDRLEGKTAT